MFLSPPEKIYRYKTQYRILALVPAVFAVFFIAIQYPDLKNILQPGWLLTCSLLVAATIFLWLLFSREEFSIHAEGIAHAGLFGQREIRWDEVQDTRYSQVTSAQMVGQHFGLLGMLIAMRADKRKSGSKASQVLKIVPASGRKIFISNAYRDHKEAMQSVLNKVNPRLLGDSRLRLKQGLPVEFGKLTLSLQGVSWKEKGPVPFTEIETFGIQGQNFCIKAQGKWLNLVNVNASKIPNVFVVMDLIHEMKSAGIATERPQSFAAVL